MGDDKDPSIILNIAAEYGICFETRKRAPFKIIFETVKVSELRSGLFQQSENLYITSCHTMQFDEERANVELTDEVNHIDERNIITVTVADEPEDNIGSNPFEV